MGHTKVRYWETEHWCRNTRWLGRTPTRNRRVSEVWTYAKHLHNTAEEQFLHHLDKSNYTQAANALEPSAKAALTPENIEKIKRLYPNEGPTRDYTTPHLALQPVTREMILFELRNMTKGKTPAPGYSGLTANHLRQLCLQSSEFLETLWQITNRLLASTTEDKTRLTSLLITKGIPITKPGLYENPNAPSKIRPIGCNETVVNLFSRLALHQIANKVKDSLHELDFGFRTKCGTETIIHTVQSMYLKSRQDRKKFILIQLDFANAFNTVSRDAIFQVINNICPELLPYLTWRYENMQVLYKDSIGSLNIKSSCGVSQGDSLSSLCFTLVMTSILEEARSNSQLQSVILSYLDDISIVHDDIGKAISTLRLIKTAAAKVGLSLNLKKSTIFVNTFSNQPNISQADQDLYPELNELTIHINGAPLLGGFIGEESYIRTQLAYKFSEMMTKIERVRRIVQNSRRNCTERAQKFLLFTRYCLTSIPTYLARVSPPHIMMNAAKPFDVFIARLVIEICKSPNLGESRQIQDLENYLRRYNTYEVWSERPSIGYRRMFLKNGGLALTSTCNVAIPAYAASLATSAKNIWNALSKTFPSMLINELNELLRVSNFNPIFGHIRGAMPILNPNRDNALPQRDLSKALQKILHHDILRWMPNQERETFISQSHKSAGAWLFANAKFPGNQLEDQAVKDEVMKLLGFQPIAHECKACNTTAINNPLEHGVECNAKHLSKPIGDLIEDGIQRGISFFQDFERQPNLRDQIHWRVKDPEDTTEYRGDFRVYHNNKQQIIDVTFSSVRTAEQLEEDKRKNYEAKLHFPAEAFIPMGIQSTGEWGPEMTNYFKSIISQWLEANDPTSTTSWSPKIAFSRQQISLAVCRANYLIMHRMRTGENYIRKSSRPISSKKAR